MSTRPNNIPPMAECGSELALGYPSTPILICQGKRKFAGKMATVQIIERSPGYKVAGSAMRWTNGGFSVRICQDGDSVFYGGTHPTLADAMEHFTPYCERVDVPALGPCDGSWIVKGKQSGDVITEIFKADSMQLARIDFERFDVLAIGAHLASISCNEVA